MNRRRFLATTSITITLPLAGCAHPDGVLDAVAVDTDRALVGQYAIDPPERRIPIVAAAVAGEGPTRAERGGPWTPEGPVAYDGAYYEVSATDVGRETRQTYDVRITVDADTAGDVRVVAYEELPAGDRENLPTERFAAARGNATAGHGFVSNHVFPRNEPSVLVPEQEYDVITVDGRAYGVDVRPAETLTLTSYRYEATRRAASASVLATELRTRYLFTLSGLSEKETAVLVKAIGETYYASGTDPGFDALVDRLRTHEPVRHSGQGGEWLVRYDGTTYWITADGIPFDDGTDATTPPRRTPP